MFTQKSLKQALLRWYWLVCCLHISRQRIEYHDNFVETACKFILIAVINLRSVCKNFKLNSKGKALIGIFVELYFIPDVCD